MKRQLELFRVGESDEAEPRWTDLPALRRAEAVTRLAGILVKALGKPLAVGGGSPPVPGEVTEK